MPLAKRIVPCLDVDHGRVVKGINFLKLRSAGDPVELAKRYSDEGADELVFLDITASSENRETMREYVEGVARAINIPFTVGGGIRSEADARLVLCSGADKTSVNTAAVEKPSLVTKLADLFGKQCVVVAIDAKRNRASGGKITVKTDGGPVWFEVYTYGGRRPTGIDAIEWAMRAEKLGAGEFLLTSMDCDGTEDGYDLDLTRGSFGTRERARYRQRRRGQTRTLPRSLRRGQGGCGFGGERFPLQQVPRPSCEGLLAEDGGDD